jgi:hypothetical protein
MYAVLVFAAITVRFTNPVLLPALLLASLPDGSALSWRALARHLRSRAVVTVGLIVVALYAVYLGMAFDSLTRFTNPKAGSVVDLSGYVPRLGRYLAASLLGYGDELHSEDTWVVIAVLALAVAGAHRLWQTNRSLMLAVAMLLVLWLLVHAAYNVFQDRYAMPAFFFVLMLAALGLSVAVGRVRRLERPWQRVGLAGLLVFAVVLFAGRNLLLDAYYIRAWPYEMAQNSREHAYDPIRDVLRDLDGPRSALLSSQALAVDRANPEIVTYDLLRHSETYGINDDSTTRIVAYVRAQQAGGKTVYYHYTEFESVHSRFNKYEQGFDAYFSALSEEFAVRELYRFESSLRVQRLYLVEPRAP